jgi:bile acid-coenzyme A ligase
VLPAGLAPDPSLSAEPLADAVSPHWKAMTSGGSTGRPKIIVDHMPGVYDPQTPALLQQVDDVLLNPGPLYHNAPFGSMHAGLFTGAHVVEMGRFDAGEALRLIGQHRVQWVNFVPTMLARIWKLPAEERRAADMSSLRVVFHMASACPIWLKEAWIDWIGPDRLFELYGGTERQGMTIITGREWLTHKGSVGKVQAGASMKVMRPDGEDCAPGEIGDIYFLPDAGRNATYHYIGADAKAAGEWESLGDLGHMDAEGYLYLADRRTDLILAGGANIYPAEVEAALDAHPEVLTSAVVGLPDDDLGQRVHAIVQRREGSQIGAAELLAHLGERLVRYKIPRSIEFSDTPLRDDAGKVRRSALREARIDGQRLALS